MRPTKSLRYTVDGSDKSYSDLGPAISLSVTLAARAMTAGLERTFYVRDSISGDTKGYSECVEIGGAFCVTTDDGRNR